VNHQLPKAVLLDLDDTILDDSGNVEYCWREACFTHQSEMRGVNPAELHHAIDKTREWFWADPVRHRQGRLDLESARREIVRMSLLEIGIDDRTLAAKIAEWYGLQREAGVQPFPDAIDTVRWLRKCGCRLALLTNGNGVAQRSKVSRFGLTDLFDLILIEGEVGFGKPDPRIYTRALAEFRVAATEAWMVGDNLEWDVVQPQKMGVFGVWVDVRGEGLPPGYNVCPNRIVRNLSELREAPTPGAS
jgi:putative hydrolase of the HAD superfamily